MTSLEWRVKSEMFIADLETILAYQNRDAEVWDTNDPMADKYYTEMDKRIVSDAKLQLIKSAIDAFKKRNLCREFTDDFNETERSIG